MALDKWATIHAYQTMVRRGQAHALHCPDCNDDLYVKSDQDGEPVFKCFYCNTITTPGLHLWDQLRKAVNV